MVEKVNMNITQRIYIAGPMSGLRHFNYPAFFEAEGRLISGGYEPINPALRDSKAVNMAALSSETGGWDDLPEGTILSEIILRNTADVLTCDGVATLEGWSDSFGALNEVSVALRTGVPVQPVEWWTS